MVGCNVDPENVTSPGTIPEVQKLKEATHLRPVAAVHSDVPHTQSFEFSILPSIVVHVWIAFVKHLLLDAKQNRPEDTVQSVAPQAQSIAFSVLPSITVHTAFVEHLLDDATQKKPVDASQSVVPQVHSTSLVDRPVTTPHVFEDVIVIVSSFQAPLYALIAVGLGDSSGRKTSSAQEI